MGYRQIMVKTNDLIALKYQATHCKYVLLDFHSQEVFHKVIRLSLVDITQSTKISVKCIATELNKTKRSVNTVSYNCTAMSNLPYQAFCQNKTGWAMSQRLTNSKLYNPVVHCSLQELQYLRGMIIPLLTKSEGQHNWVKGKCKTVYNYSNSTRQFKYKWKRKRKM